MEPVLQASRATPCPSCGASTRPDAPWCSLCHTDLRPPAPAPEPPAATLPVELPPPSYDQAVVGPTDGRSWPCSRCRTHNALDRDVCSACGAGFLSAVRDSEPPLLVLPGIGDLTKISRTRRLLLAVALVAAVLVPLAVLTLLLTGRPAPAATIPTGAGTGALTPGTQVIPVTPVVPVPASPVVPVPAVPDPAIPVPAVPGGPVAPLPTTGPTDLPSSAPSVG